MQGAPPTCNPPPSLPDLLTISLDSSSNSQTLSVLLNGGSGGGGGDECDRVDRGSKQG